MRKRNALIYHVSFSAILKTSIGPDWLENYPCPCCFFRLSGLKSFQWCLVLSRRCSWKRSSLVLFCRFLRSDISWNKNSSRGEKIPHTLPSFVDSLTQMRVVFALSRLSLKFPGLVTPVENWTTTSDLVWKLFFSALFVVRVRLLKRIFCHRAKKCPPSNQSNRFSNKSWFQFLARCCRWAFLPIPSIFRPTSAFKEVRMVQKRRTWVQAKVALGSGSGYL